MPRSGPNGTFDWNPGDGSVVANTTISPGRENSVQSDVRQTFNTVQPITYGGTGVADGKPLDNTFGVKNNADPTKIGVLNASNIPTATTRTYDLPYYSGTLGLVSDIRGQIYGLTMSNNGTDAVNDIDIQPGSAVDSAGVVSMVLATLLTKRKDAAWAVGSGNGGMDTGSAPASGTLHIFLIRRPDTGVVDALFSANPTSPTLPANYTQSRRIGSLIISGSAFLIFTQYGDDFFLGTPILDVSATNPGTAAVVRTISTPGGLVTKANIIVGVTNTGATGPSSVYISSLAVADVSPTLDQVANVSNAAGRSIFANSQIFVYTGGTSNIRSRLTFSDANTILRIQTMGWTDTRGRIS